MGSVARIVVVAVLALAGCRGEHRGARNHHGGTRPRRRSGRTGRRRARRASRPVAGRAGARQADPLRRPARPHDLLGRRLHDAACRCCRARARIRRPTPATSRATARRSTSGASTTTPRRITPQHWQETKESIRQCNAVAGDPANPDMVAFLGWEWTQVGATPEDHYGHKNVIFRDTDEDQRADAADQRARPQLVGALRQRRAALAAPAAARSLDFAEPPALLRLRRASSTSCATTPICPDGVDTRKLPGDCLETRRDARTSCSRSSTSGASTRSSSRTARRGASTRRRARRWDKQLTGAQHDPERQTLIEVFSGHGNSEEYRDWQRGHGRRPTATPSAPSRRDGLPAVLLAGRRDHPRPLRRRRPPTSASSASPTARAQLPRRRRRRAT